jgi:UDP-N-acetylmuramyl pentapeptide phosphotransferase/UDP-N-acetylglucosamine-1-phosphate transferase
MLDFLIGLVLSGIATLGAVKFLPKLGLLDYPERYGLQRKKLPYPGGLVFLVLAIIFFLVLRDFWFLSLALVEKLINSVLSTASSNFNKFNAIIGESNNIS